MKNKSYIGISLIVLIFGIYAIPKIIHRIKNGTVVQGNSMDNISNNGNSNQLIEVGSAPSFELTNQNNQKISNNDYLKKVYVVEFFFTTCPTICPKMNKNMVKIQNKFFGNPNFGIASISIDPEHDTAEVLKEHAQKLGATATNWHFLTGDKEYIYNISNKGFNLYAGQNPKIAGGFEHSGLFALVDKKGNIRCRKDEFGNPAIYYDGLDSKAVENLIQDITILLKE